MLKKKTKRSATSKRRTGPVEVDVPCIPDHRESACFLKNLVRVVESKPNRILLRFFSGSILNPGTALSAYEVLRSAKHLRIEAEAISSIIGPALILFFLAETRTMSRTAYLFFPVESFRPRSHTGELLLGADAWKFADEEEPEPHAWMEDIRRRQVASIQSIIQVHVVWSDVTCAPMSFEVASDYGLLGKTRQGAHLSSQESETMPNGRPRPCQLIPPFRQTRPK